MNEKSTKRRRQFYSHFSLPWQVFTRIYLPASPPTPPAITTATTRRHVCRHNRAGGQSHFNTRPSSFSLPHFLTQGQKWKREAAGSAHVFRRSEKRRKEDRLQHLPSLPCTNYTSLWTNMEMLWAKFRDIYCEEVQSTKYTTRLHCTKAQN